MRRGVKALEGSNSRDQLGWLVLRGVAESSPSTETSLIAYVSGGDSTPELGHTSASQAQELIGNTLLKLKELAFIQLTKEQIAITDEGRRFLDKLPVVGHLGLRTPYVALLGARMPTLLTEYTPQLKRFCQECLTGSRAVT